MSEQLNTVQGSNALVTPLQTAGTTSYDPMAKASAVAPLYSLAYIQGIEALAKRAASSKLYGDLNESQATMILQTGLEMGIPPTVALRNIASFKGKTTIAAQLMLAQVKSAGYDVEITENTAERASITIQKPGKKPFTATFTIEDARKAGYLDRNALYKTIPATMILCRAIATVCRYGAPEVAAGLYTPEEMQDYIEVDATATTKAGQSVTNHTAAISDRGWTIEAQEEFADLADRLYIAFKAVGKIEAHAVDAQKWRNRMASDHAETLIPAMQEWTAKIEDAAKAKTAKPVEPEVPEGEVEPGTDA